jgi:hypothetical protein
VAVHRSGASSEDREEISVSLGHLLITIDDFESLTKQIHTHTGENPFISFIGGHIDEAEDLRSLTERELADVRIQSAGVTVDLTRTSAFYRGPRGLGQQIQNWARSHRSPLRWRLRSKDLSNKALWGSTAIVGITISLFYFFIAWIAELLQPIGVKLQSVSPVPLYFESFMPAWGCAPFVLLYMLWFLSNELVWSSSTIVPLSRDEYRKDKVTYLRQVVTWTIATLAIAATLIATQLKK